MLKMLSCHARGALLELEPALAALGGLVARAWAVQGLEHEPLGARCKGLHEVGADPALPGGKLLGTFRHINGHRLAIFGRLQWAHLSVTLLGMRGI